MSNLAVLPPLTRTRTLRFALRQILLPLCWSKMMMGWSCWTHSPLGWVSHLRTSHHLSSLLTPSEARFPRLPLFWPMTLHQSLNTSSSCHIVCPGWLILPLLHRPLQKSSPWLLNSSRLCPLMRWSTLSIVQDLCLRRFAPAIGPTDPTRRRTELWRSFTVLLGAGGSTIIGTSYRQVSMANGLTGESFHYCLALT